MEDTSSKYIQAVGRRKTSVARVRIVPASKSTFVVNEKELHAYFPTEEMQMAAVKQDLHYFHYIENPAPSVVEYFNSHGKGLKK